MKLDLYKIDVILAGRGLSLQDAGIDYRWLQRAREGADTRRPTVKKIADALGTTPAEITIRE